MLIKLRKKTAQSTLEYAVLVVIVIAALLAMQSYIKRGISGKFKDSTQQISEEQFDIHNTVYNKVTTTCSQMIDAQNSAGSFGETVYSNTIINMTSSTNTTP